MLTDRYDLPISTVSPAARDAYVRGMELALTLYPGAIAAFDAALAADPDFALAHCAKAQVFLREAKPKAARAAQASATLVAAKVSDRERSHLAFWDLMLAGQTAAAIDALYAHLQSWPRDALVLASAANPNGLIGASGQLGQKHRVALLLDSLAPHYGDDFWFLAHHAMGLSEDGQLAAARPKIDRSLTLNRQNAHGAHAFAHVCYESGDLSAAADFLSGWLPDYPPEAFFNGHISWHYALVELAAGSWENALRLYRNAIFMHAHSGGPQQIMHDGAAFLWRAELAGHPRDRQAWEALYTYAKDALPRPAAGLADMHVLLTQAVAGDQTGLEARTRQMAAAADEGRYPSGDFLPQLARGIVAFEQGDFPASIAALAPLMGQNERIGGSRAQHDLIEFTLLKAYLNAGLPDQARHLLAARRPGAAGPAVDGVSALH